MAEHYAGDDSNVQILAAGILAVDYTSGAEQALEQAGKPMHVMMPISKKKRRSYVYAPKRPSCAWSFCAHLK